MTNPPDTPPQASKPTFIDKPETIVVDSKKVSCDGGGGALGHPKVYYEMGEDNFVECGYCDRRFVLKGTTAAR